MRVVTLSFGVSLEEENRITLLLQRVRDGDIDAEREAVELVYRQLRDLAGGLIGAPRGGPLQPTSLAHEARLKLNGKLDHVRDRDHFFSLAVRAMRQILADVARAQGRQKRGGDRTLVTLSGIGASDPTDTFDVARLHEVLTKLRDQFPRQAEAFELRVLGALTHDEISGIMGVSDGTVRNDVKFARAWLLKHLEEEKAPDG